MHDANALGAMSHSVKLDAIDFGDGVDAIYLSASVRIGLLSNSERRLRQTSLYAQAPCLEHIELSVNLFVGLN
jgi:hypothetical protein